MHPLTVQQMREADRRAIEVLGIPSQVLMDRAGYAVFQHIPKGPVIIICGKGNNGGDGYVLARYCHLAGYDTTVITLADDETLTEDTAIFKTIYTRLGGKIIEATNESTLIQTLATQDQSATWVDAMLGTGTQGETTGLIRTAIEHWPQTHTIAIDIPSGLNADTGKPCGNTIVATKTITIQFTKTGLQTQEAKKYLGTLHTVDIGIPEICADDINWNELELH